MDRMVRSEVIKTVAGKEIILGETFPYGIFEFRKPRFVVYIAHTGPEISIIRTTSLENDSVSIKNAISELENIILKERA